MLGDGSGVGGERQDAGQDGADTGRPADRESAAHEGRTAVAPYGAAAHGAGRLRDIG